MSLPPSSELPYKRRKCILTACLGIEILLHSTLCILNFYLGLMEVSHINQFILKPLHCPYLTRFPMLMHHYGWLTHEGPSLRGKKKTGQLLGTAKQVLPIMISKQYMAHLLVRCKIWYGNLKSEGERSPGMKFLCKLIRFSSQGLCSDDFFLELCQTPLEILIPF